MGTKRKKLTARALDELRGEMKFVSFLDYKDVVKAGGHIWIPCVSAHRGLEKRTKFLSSPRGTVWNGISIKAAKKQGFKA